MGKEFPWKLVIIFGPLGVVLSFIIAIISGVGFGAALFRALLFGVGFSALAVGLNIVIKRYLPELLEEGEPEKPKIEPRETEDGIEIVLQGEDPDIAVYTSQEEDPDLLETVEDESLSSQDSEENLEPENPVSASFVDPAGEEDFSSLEKLPSLDGFSGSFSGSPLTGDEKTINKVESLESDNDPVVIAKAIQTMLKKDQKG